MERASWRRIASGVALVIAALYVAVLHGMNYSKEHQLYGIALVSVFGFLSINPKESRRDAWWW
jgi:hypothetical protein